MLGWTRPKPRERGRERRQEPPADSAAQVIWLILAITVAGAPHVLFLPLWVPLLVGSLCTWRMVAAVKRWRLPRAWVRVPLTIMGFVLVLLSYRQVSGLDAGSSLLLVMVAMKLLETRGARDRAVVVFICYFLLFAAFLREQEIRSVVYLLLGVTFTTAALLQIARRGRVMPPAAALKTASSLVVQATPIMMLLFVLFPRIPGPFWALPQPGSQAITGLADTMTPGDISELALSDRVAFRVRFDGEAPPPNELYWRGPVLSRFDGRSWLYQRQAPASFGTQAEPAAIHDYEMTLEPHGRRWLLALETPVHWTASRAYVNRAFQLMNPVPIEQRLAYRARSHLGGTTPGTLGPGASRTLTYLPDSGNARTAALARKLMAASSSPSDYLQSVLAMFRDEEFFYTLKPARLGSDAIDEFLFDTRAGFCGHYASAFAVLARAAGLPARVVTGYQGGERNPLGQYWIVRDADAHAWAEAWLEGRWVRFDPTAAVAPERIELGLLRAAAEGSLVDADALLSSQILNRLVLTWDAANAAWNRWVLAFGPDQQTDLLRAAGFDKPTVKHLIILMSISISLFLLTMAWYLRGPRGPRPDRIARAYQRLCRRAGRETRPRRATEGPTEYAAAISTGRPDLGRRLLPLFGLYTQLRYDGLDDDAQADRFIDGVNRYRPHHPLKARLLSLITRTRARTA